MGIEPQLKDHYFYTSKTTMFPESQNFIHTYDWVTTLFRFTLILDVKNV